MAAVVAVNDEQLLILAQTAKGRGLRIGRGAVLGQDPASLIRASPCAPVLPVRAQPAPSLRGGPDSPLQAKMRFQSYATDRLL
jgi:hypothetical protein